MLLDSKDASFGSAFSFVDTNLPMLKALSLQSGDVPQRQNFM